MSKISNQIEQIEIEALYRSAEITQMFSQLNFLDEKLNGSNNSSTANILEKYYLGRSIVVFSYGTIEKFVKTLTQHALISIIDNEYFYNGGCSNTKDFLSILKFKNNPMDLYNLLMYYKNNSSADNDFEYLKDKGYFGGRDRIDSTTIAHICDVLNLNRNEPLLKIPKATIDSLCANRMILSHGDYIGDLKLMLNPNRRSITIEEINTFINDTFKLTDVTKNDLITFIKDYKSKITDLLTEIDDYVRMMQGA